MLGVVAGRSAGMSEHYVVESRRPSTWAVGYTAFAGVVLIVTGFLQAVAGIVALADDEFYVVGQEWTFKFDVTTWGWVHLGIGAVLLLAGFGVFSGSLAARVVGVLIAAVSLVVAFAWLPWYPVWAIVIIAVDVAVIWALTAHGRDVVMWGAGNR